MTIGSKESMTNKFQLQDYDDSEHRVTTYESWYSSCRFINHHDVFSELLSLTTVVAGSSKVINLISFESSVG